MIHLFNALPMSTIVKKKRIIIIIMDYRITPFSLIHSIEFQEREKNDFQRELIKLMIRRKKEDFSSFSSFSLSHPSNEHLFCLDTLERRRSRKDLVTTIKMTDRCATFFSSFSLTRARALFFNSLIEV